MATSFVEIKERGFWIPDWLLQIWLLLMAKEIDNLPSKDESILDLRNSWYLEGMHICVGCMNTSLDKFITSEGRKTILLSLVTNVLEKVNSNPKIITRDEMNNLILEVASELKNIDSRWDDSQIERVRNNELFQKDIELPILARVAELFRQLLEGKMETTAASEIDYWPWNKSK